VTSPASGRTAGRVDVAWLRRALPGVPLLRAADGRLVLAVDVTPWLRPDAGTVPDRSFRRTLGLGTNNKLNHADTQSIASCFQRPAVSLGEPREIDRWHPGRKARG
jgi:hypothetical protein